jgi:hypothetical protein
VQTDTQVGAEIDTGQDQVGWIIPKQMAQPYEHRVCRHGVQVPAILIELLQGNTTVGCCAHGGCTLFLARCYHGDAVAVSVQGMVERPDTRSFVSVIIGQKNVHKVSLTQKCRENFTVSAALVSIAAIPL